MLQFNYQKRPTTPSTNFKFPLEKLILPTWVRHPLLVQLAEVGGKGSSERHKVQTWLPGAHTCVWEVECDKAWRKGNCWKLSRYPKGA